MYHVCTMRYQVTVAHELFRTEPEDFTLSRVFMACVPDEIGFLPCYLAFAPLLSTCWYNRGLLLHQVCSNNHEWKDLEEYMYRYSKCPLLMLFPDTV